MVDNNLITAIAIIAVVIAFIGALQLTFQQQLQTAIFGVNKSVNFSGRNFEAIVQSEADIIRLLIAINHTVTDLISDSREARERDANLTKAETEKLVDDLGVIPNIALSVNQTLEEIRSEQPQSNFTAQKIATERIENMTQDLQAIKSKLGVATAN